MSDAELEDSVRGAAGRVLIGFKDPHAVAGVDGTGRRTVSGASVIAAKRLLASLGVEVRWEAALLPVVAATIRPEILRTLRASPLIDHVTPVLPLEFHSQDIPWNVARVRAPEAWSSSTGNGVRLAILDTGRPLIHPDFPSPVASVDCSATGGYADNIGHGTAVAGVAVAVNNAINLVGVSHGVDVVIIRVRSESQPLNQETMLCGLQWAYSLNASVVNMSFGGPQSFVPVIEQIKSNYYWHGMLMVASVGNTNGQAVTWPANMPEVVGVTATDQNDQRWSGAAIGSQVELSAPGVDVRTLIPSYLGNPGGLGIGCTALASVHEASCTGTSYAAPHVAAAAAVLKAYNPGWSNIVLRERMVLSAVPLGPASHYGAGLLDIRGAIDYVHPLPPPNEPYQAIISGPPEISPSATCTWVAGVWQGGSTPPYMYEWRRGGQLVSIQDYYEGAMDGDVSFNLSLTVTSSEGWQSSDLMKVKNTGFGECLAI